jgi:hypothetical protein
MRVADRKETNKKGEKLTKKDFDQARKLMDKIVKQNEGATIVFSPTDDGAEGFVQFQNTDPMLVLQALCKSEVYDEHELIAFFLSRHPHIIEKIIKEKRGIKKMMKFLKLK